ncbi:hypothetical protein [Brenneria uluponensis]|uniref:hypothetical protein n=1 Tax=Brenneria uluponensis TaxID=3057057 RepID=UPI0028F0AED6|nr:hypothetical protein [Brenneria ulupoensis]
MPGNDVQVRRHRHRDHRQPELPDPGHQCRRRQPGMECQRAGNATIQAYWRRTPRFRRRSPPAMRPVTGG